MESFVRKHQKKINGTLGCFDRMLFRGYLPIQTGCAMAYFLNQNHIMFRDLKDLLRGYQHYWVTSQSEYATDIAFRSSSDLRELFPRLLSHSTLCFGAKDVMGFLGRKLTGHFLGEIISDMKDGGWGRRIPGARIKHRVKENWLKMYDKDGSVLRVEMVINNPEEFKVRKKVSRKNKRVLEWVSMRKGVAYLSATGKFPGRQTTDIWRHWQLLTILRLQSGNWTILRQERRRYRIAA